MQAADSRDIQWYHDDLVKIIHCWQRPPWIKGEVEVDAQALMRRYQQQGIHTVIPLAKHTDGVCFFDDGTQGFSLGRDYLAEFIEAARDHEIRIVPYYIVTVDRLAGSQNPEWACRRPDGGIKRMFNSIACCINNPGYIEYVLNHVRLLQANYDVDGLWSDELNWSDQGCYCNHCRGLFGRHYGLDLGQAQGSKEALEFWDSSWLKLIARMHAIIHEDHPGRLFVFNGGGIQANSRPEFETFADANSCEAHSALFASDRGRRLHRIEKPYEITYASEKDWGGWASCTLDEMRLHTAVILAHGGTALIGHNIPPQFDLYDSSFEIYGTACQLASEIGPYVRNTSPMYDVGLIWPGAEEPKPGPVLMQQDIAFGYVTMHESWKDLQLIYSPTCSPSDVTRRKELFSNVGPDDVYDDAAGRELPGQIDEAAASKIRHFVEQGGVFIQELPHPGVLTGVDSGQFVLSDVLGVENHGFTEYQDHYFAPRAEGLRVGWSDSFPILVQGKGTRLHPTTAETLVDLVPPLKPMSDLYRLQKPTPNAADKSAPRTPAVTLNRYGKGLGVCIAAPLSRACMAQSVGKGHEFHFWPRKLMGSLIHSLINAPILYPASPLGVEVLVNRQPGQDRTVVCLLNHYGLKGVSGGRTAGYEPNPEIVRLADIEVSLNMNRLGGHRDARLVVGSGELDARVENQRLVLRLSCLEQLAIITISA